MKARPAIWAAAVKLFIPSQILNIPRVIVSTVKYSTVPKSDNTSIKTSANPAIIAGRARYKSTQTADNGLLSLASSI